MSRWESQKFKKKIDIYGHVKTKNICAVNKEKNKAYRQMTNGEKMLAIQMTHKGLPYIMSFGKSRRQTPQKKHGQNI